MEFATPEQLEEYVQARIREAYTTAEAAYREKQIASLDNFDKWMETTIGDAQHLYHHNDKTPSISMEVEKNTKGYNWRVKVSDASSIEEALLLLNQGNDELKKAYGQSD